MANHITVNGHAYSSVDEMPSDVRLQYEAAMQLLSKNSGVLADHAPGNISISTTGNDPAHHTFKVVTQTTASRIVVNGKEYARWENVPPEARAAFQSAGVNPFVPFAAGNERLADATPTTDAWQSLRRMMKRGVKWLAIVVAFTSIAGFVFHVAMGLGWCGPMRWTNWGPGETAEAVQLPDGQYAMMLRHFGRIQIYSSDLRFLYGWNTPGIGAVLQLSDDGNLNLYTLSRGRVKWYHEVYDVNGTLLSRDSNGPNPTNANLPAHGEQLVHIPDGSPWWWTYPFRGPFCAFGTLFGDIFVGIVLSYLLSSREERLAYRWKIIFPPA